MEKKNKRKFWGTLTSFLLTFMFISSWAVLGIALAISTANVNVGGNISFNATDVQATISKAVFTGNKSTDTTAEKCKALSFSADSEKTSTDDDIVTWKNIALNFIDADGGTKGQDVTMTFVITNTNAENKDMSVTFSDIAGAPTNATMTITAQGADDADATEVKTEAAESLVRTVAQNKTLTVKVTFHIKDKNKTASVNGWGFKLALTNANA